jgi:hypothetical protein
VIDFNPQFMKAALSINVTEFGILIVVSFLQYSNAFSPIETTVLGMLTEVRSLQLAKVPSDIRVSFFGSFREVIPRPEQAPSQIDMISSGKDIEVISE